MWYLCGVVEGKALRGVMCQNVMVQWRFQRNQNWQTLWWNYFVLQMAQGEQNEQDFKVTVCNHGSDINVGKQKQNTELTDFIHKWL